ncbi:MAG TPA: hypothetical protein DDW67_01510 [Elusimicrobia bacterium]|nr:hypothetical protein [Elusimicrobiota bacterium]
MPSAGAAATSAALMELMSPAQACPAANTAAVKIRVFLIFEPPLVSDNYIFAKTRSFHNGRGTPAAGVFGPTPAWALDKSKAAYNNISVGLLRLEEK